MNTMGLSPRTAAAVAAAVALAGCAQGIKREELDSELASIREEMQRGDQEMGTRLAAQESRANDLAARQEQLSRDLQSLRNDFNTQIERMGAMMRFNVPVHFGFDEATVRNQDRAVLDRFASVVSEHYGGATITIEGFTDQAGSAAYNRRLGQQRAEAVREYLVTTGGLSAELVRAVSYGEDTSRQITPGATGPGADGVENRRVALVVDYRGGMEGGGGGGRGR
jgi:peptidoglycan-associated lipoprotein